MSDQAENKSERKVESQVEGELSETSEQTTIAASSFKADSSAKPEVKSTTQSIASSRFQSLREFAKLSGHAALSFGIAIFGWGALNSLIGPKADTTLVISSAEFASQKESLRDQMKSAVVKVREREVLMADAKPLKTQNIEKRSNILMNDPFIKEKWGLVKTNTKQAWDVSQGSKDIVVAVIDTGIDKNHVSLACNIFTNPGESGVVDSTECNALKKSGKDILAVKKCNKATDGIDNDGNGLIDDVNGWNFVTNNNDLNDNHGHGTHIAGIIGGCGKDGIGVSGVAPKVSIMALKYFDLKVPNTNHLKNTVSAIKYVVKMQEKNKNLKFLINYSGGGVDYAAEEFAAIKEAERAGILFIAAAGNEKSNSDETGKHYYPADYGLTNIISVTAVNREDTKVLASSNFGVRTVDLAAPGENIYSAMPGNSFGPMTGTSQATAFVTGVAVLIMGKNREFSAPDVKKYILRTGDEYATLLSKTGTAKLLNSYKALTSLDSGVSFSGSIAANSAGIDKKMFRSQPNLKDPSINPTALSDSGDEDNKATDEIASFGRDFIKAIGKSTALRNLDGGQPESSDSEKQ
jgi:thermitase